MGEETNRSLRLSFHGRIIDHLGIQMYQSPVAAVAELIANAWDADAENVYIRLPDSIDGDAELVTQDDGLGMTFEECQEKYLNVGRYRRETGPEELSEERHRPVLGRKGIGKFAGFGIAELIRVETISKKTGEKTVFELDLNELRSNQFVVPEGRKIAVLEYLPPDENRVRQHGTRVCLRRLKMGRRPSLDQFAKSMARRFLLHRRVHNFRIIINDQPMPEDDLSNVEYVFPRDYRNGEWPEGLRVQDGWGVEHLPSGREIRWRVFFYREPIEEDDLRGIAVFARGKIAQRPFFFNLSGGLGGQHGQEYMSGQVEADYIDGLDEDIIATERQRVNWEHKETIPLEQWGQERVKGLLRIWRDRRGEKRRREIEEKVASFSNRLERLARHERRTVEQALSRLGSIPTLSDEQFQSLGEAMLQAWEQGRLHELIDDLATRTDITGEWLLSVLAEADVLVALNLAEAVRTKIEAVCGLKALVEKGELEAAVRNYIAEKPYLLDPKWETFKKETSIKHVMEEAARDSGLAEETEGQRKRIDLALRSGGHLLVVEFMRPGKRADYDHLSRCRRYVYLIRDKVKANTALGINEVTGLIVADRLERDPSVRHEVEELKKSGIFAYSWQSLLHQAECVWREFLEIIGSRAPSDHRLRTLQKADQV